MSHVWPIEIDGHEFHPIPESWIEHGVDDGECDQRFLAVSAACRARGMLTVRHVNPLSNEVVRATMMSCESPSGDGRVPALLAREDREWPRSIIPDRGANAADAVRDAELDHLQDLWGERVADIPSDDEDEQVLADGGVGLADAHGEAIARLCDEALDAADPNSHLAYRIELSTSAAREFAGEAAHPGTSREFVVKDLRYHLERVVDRAESEAVKIPARNALQLLTIGPGGEACV